MKSSAAISLQQLIIIVFVFLSKLLLTTTYSTADSDIPSSLQDQCVELAPSSAVADCNTLPVSSSPF